MKKISVSTDSAKNINSKQGAAKKAEIRGIVKATAIAIVLIAAFVGGYVAASKQSDQTQSLQAETHKAQLDTAKATGYNAGYAQAKTDLGK